MPDTKAMRDEMEKCLARARATIEQYPEGLTAEKDLEVSALVRKAGELKSGIESEEKLEAKKRDLADMDRFLNEPVRTLQHGVGNGEPDSERKALLNLGWEFRSNVWHAPNSMQGKTVRNPDGSYQQLGTIAMYQDEVLFGEIPTDNPDAASFYKTTRAAMRPEYRAAYAKLIRCVGKAGDISMAYTMLSGSEQKALSEGSDPAGGFLVPPDVQGEMLARVAQQAVMRRRARVQTTSRDVLKYPMIQPNTTSGSIYSSGFVGDWVGETPAFTDTDPAFGSFEIPIRKIRVATKLSNDLVADANVNVLAFLAQNGSENMALVEDRGFINGNGSSLQPRGILQSGAATVDVEGSTSNTVSNTAAAAGSAPKLIDVVYAVPAQYASKGSWLMCRSIEGKIRKLIDAQGRFLWPALSGSAFAGTPGTLMDYPVDNSDWMPNDGTDANKVAVFGDLSAYIIAQRAQITSRVLNERFADTDQVGIILFERVGGDTWNPDAIRIGIV